jgi:RNA polymerase-binding transcription factor DksA
MLPTMVMMLWHVAFCVCRNKDDDVSKVDVIEEFEDESSTKKKKGKKEKKRKKDDDDDDDDDDGDIEDLAKELDDVTLEQGKKDKKQSKVSGVEYIVCVCVVCA